MMATIAVSDWLCGLDNPLGLIDVKATRDAFRASVRRRVHGSLPSCGVLFVDHDTTGASVHDVHVSIDLQGEAEPHGTLTARSIVRGWVWDILKGDGYAVRVRPVAVRVRPVAVAKRLRGWEVIENPDGTSLVQEVDQEFWNSGEVTSWSG